MYTTQKSIENKVGSVNGWKDLLMSVGFRFEPAANGIPSSVFFPQSDPEERLTQCSASLQALLGIILFLLSLNSSLRFYFHSHFQLFSKLIYSIAMALNILHYFSK